MHLRGCVSINQDFCTWWRPAGLGGIDRTAIPGVHVTCKGSGVWVRVKEGVSAIQDGVSTIKEGVGAIKDGVSAIKEGVSAVRS